MNRCEFERLVTDTLNVVGDNPFSKYPSVTVFRHKDSKKWICAVMTIRRRLLGLNDDSYVDIVNFKCGNEILYSMLELNGVYPAYHMNKSSWVSVTLDGSCDDEDIKFLLGVSHELTK